MKNTVKNTPPPIEEITRRIQVHRDDLSRLGATMVAVFGSCARSTQGPGSDIDVVVDLRPGFSYFDIGEMEQILSSEFNLDVNLVDIGGVPENHPIRRDLVHVF